MATTWKAPTWRMPNEKNQSKFENYGLTFDGSVEKITFNPIALSTDCTLSVWAKRSSTANMDLLGNTTTYGYGVYFYGTTNLYIKGSGAGVTNFNNTAIQTALARTDWVHWLFVKDITAGTTSVYVDGNLAQSLSHTNPINEISSIGGSGLAAGTQYIWNGNIDEVAIFDYALSARQIKQDIYNGTTSGKTADLNNISNLTPPVAWYRMGD